MHKCEVWRGSPGVCPADSHGMEYLKKVHMRPRKSVIYFYVYRMDSGGRLSLMIFLWLSNYEILCSLLF